MREPFIINWPKEESDYVFASHTSLISRTMLMDEIDDEESKQLRIEKE